MDAVHSSLLQRLRNTRENRQVCDFVRQFNVRRNDPALIRLFVVNIDPTAEVVNIGKTTIAKAYIPRSGKRACQFRQSIVIRGGAFKNHLEVGLNRLR